MTEEQLKTLGYVFPERVNILLCRSAKGAYSLTFTKFSNKKIKVDNVKFGDTGAFMLDGSTVTSLGVYDFATFDNFYTELERLSICWVRVKEVTNK